MGGSRVNNFLILITFTLVRFGCKLLDNFEWSNNQFLARLFSKFNGYQQFGHVDVSNNKGKYLIFRARSTYLCQNFKLVQRPAHSCIDKKD